MTIHLLLHTYCVCRYYKTRDEGGVGGGGGAGGGGGWKWRLALAGINNHPDKINNYSIAIKNAIVSCVLKII